MPSWASINVDQSALVKTYRKEYCSSLIKFGANILHYDIITSIFFQVYIIMVRYGSLNASRVPLYITSNIVPNEHVVEELNKRAYDGLVEPDSLCFNILGLEGSFKHFSLDDITKHNSENFQPKDNPNCSAVFVVYIFYQN